MPITPKSPLVQSPLSLHNTVIDSGATHTMSSVQHLFTKLIMYPISDKTFILDDDTTKLSVKGYGTKSN